MANHLPMEKREAVVRALVEGNSVRSTARLTGVYRNTVLRILADVGARCADLLDEMVYEVNAPVIEVDEIWSFVGKKRKNVTREDEAAQRAVGDAWVWVSLCVESKLVINHHVGGRDGDSALAFIADLAPRLACRPQITSDGLSSYVDAIEQVFAREVDYAQLVKHFGGGHPGLGKYSPAKVQWTTRTPIQGHPDDDHICTSFVERQNLTMRMMMRRFTRLTNAFSKTLDNHKAAIALHFAYYNFVRPHLTLDGATPAMAARLAPSFWSVADLLNWPLPDEKLALA